MVKVRACVEEVPGLIAAMARGDRREVCAVADRIHRLEHECDQVKSEIRNHLSNSLFTSVERSEVLHLITLIDSIADDADDVGKLVSARQTPLPGKLGEGLAGLGALVLEVTAGLTGIAERLRDLMDGNAGRAEAASVLGRIAALGETSFAVEEAELGFLRGLFAHEPDLGAVDVVVLMEIARKVAAVAKQAWNVADGIRRIVMNR